MYCIYCGAQIQPDQRFCGACGRPATPESPAPGGGGRPASHLRALGILWIAFSAIHLLRGGGRLLGLRVVRIIGHVWSDDVPWAWPLGGVFSSMFGLVAVLAFLLAIAGFLAGFGLLEHRSWARSLAIVLAVIALLSPILGTALGIYTLWVLLPDRSEAEYRQMARSV
ncbi:MAG TPA: zinc ribbon domain-containing protein [Bryobacteraceae bacterium]|nr:zinc ribbon domain-containing protein [Bryobacteraceae bacterium]